MPPASKQRKFGEKNYTFFCLASNKLAAKRFVEEERDNNYSARFVPKAGPNGKTVYAVYRRKK